MLDFVINKAHVKDDDARRALINAGFAYNQQGKRIGSLSGGERARVLFVALSLEQPNFLILDEPTNHIDIEGKEQLEEQLCDSPAAVLLTSHDRSFINAVAERFVWIRDEKLQELNSPESFFRSAPASPSAKQDHDGSQPAAEPVADDDDNLLEMLVELEEKLNADKQRKTKFQKVGLQKKWQAEIEALYERLNAQG